MCDDNTAVAASWEPFELVAVVAFWRLPREQRAQVINAVATTASSTEIAELKALHVAALELWPVLGLPMTTTQRDRAAIAATTFLRRLAMLLNAEACPREHELLSNCFLNDLEGTDRVTLAIGFGINWLSGNPERDVPAATLEP